MKNVLFIVSFSQKFGQITILHIKIIYSNVFYKALILIVFFFLFLPHKCVLDMDKPLDEMETKIKGTVAKKALSTHDELQVLKMGDIVAVFNPKWNKWIRGVIKAKDANGSYYVWALDYGVPLISKPLHIIQLPPMYARMNSKCQRVHLGGIINCVPSEPTYDFEKNENVILDQTNWSTKALEIAQNFISRAIELEFEVVAEMSVVDKQYKFGHLKAQKLDGTWIDLAKCLAGAVVAKPTTENWLANIHRLDTVNQKIYKTINGVPLKLQQVVLPIESGQVAKEIDIGQRENAADVTEAYDQMGSRSNSLRNVRATNQTIAKKSSAAKGNQLSFSEFRSSQATNGRHGNISRGLNFSNQRSHFNNHQHRFKSDFNDSFHNGVMRDRRYWADIEFFESSFKMPNSTPVKKVNPSDSEDKDKDKDKNEDKDTDKDKDKNEDKDKDKNEDKDKDKDENADKTKNLNGDKANGNCTATEPLENDKKSNGGKNPVDKTHSDATKTSDENTDTKPTTNETE